MLTGSAGACHAAIQRYASVRYNLAWRMMPNSRKCFSRSWASVKSRSMNSVCLASRLMRFHTDDSRASEDVDE